MDVKSPQGFLDKVKMLPMLAEMGKFFPKTVSTGPCKEVIKRDNFSLLDFPVLQCWPKDAGRFITLPCVVIARPQDRQAQRRHVSHADLRRAHHRHALAAPESRRRTLPRSPAHSSPEQCGRERPARASAAVDIMARTSGGSVLAEGDRPAGKMEVAVAIGTDPALTFSAIVPAPPDVEEYLIAGFLRQKPVELVKCETVDLEVPAAAEIVLEGLRQSRRTPHRRPVRRSHRLLFAGRSVSGLSRDLRHPPQESDLLDHHRRQAAAWKTVGWAKPSSAFFCR